MGPSHIIPVQLVRLGRLGYSGALAVQHHFQKANLECSPAESCHTLLVVEHNPVFTTGLRMKLDAEEITRLECTGAEIVHTDRGGLTTFHGPGQLVVYPVLHLTKFHKLALRSYVEALESVAVHIVRMFGLPAKKSVDSVSHTGAWVNDKKICAIGVHCKRYVTTHGLAMNCNVDLDWYKHIVPCGIADKDVTSLSAELGRNVTIDEAVDQLIQSFQFIFKCNVREASLSPPDLTAICGAQEV